jgi:hypothetical protein
MRLLERNSSMTLNDFNSLEYHLSKTISLKHCLTPKISLKHRLSKTILFKHCLTPKNLIKASFKQNNLV